MILTMSETLVLKTELVELGGNLAYAPNQALVDHISSYLSDVYLFGSYDKVDDFDLRVNNIQDETLREEFQNVLFELSASHGNKDIANYLYSMCGNREISGILHGWKRTMITDAMRLSFAVSSHLAPDGIIADIGSNSGYLLNWLCGLTNRKGVGVDISSEAIELANRLKSHEHINFYVNPWRGMHFPEKPSLIICSDTEHLSIELLDWVHGELAEGGILLHIDNELPDLKILRKSGFGCQHVEVTGGHKYDGFDSRIASIISREPQPRFSPPHLLWDNYFQQWCNSNLVAHHKKSMSQFLTQFA